MSDAIPGQAVRSARTISVIVPSWRRPADLDCCLRALAAQTQSPLEVVVGARAGDDDTTRTAQAVATSTGLAIRVVTTPDPGVIAAMSAALADCRGDIIALTDDDAEPRADWLQRLDACFDDGAVGAAGGRDWQPKERGDRTEVGRVQWFGRVIGNHHLGAGPARNVDVLKGANLAMRAPILRASGFDARLRGGGAQMFWELALCLPARRAGWKLVYDPAIAVDHHIALRHDDDQRHRGVFAAQGQADATHNATLILLEHLRGVARLAFIAWAFAVGTRMEPGIAQVPRLVLLGERDVFAKWRATVAGTMAGLKSFHASGHDAAARLPRPPGA